MFKLPLKNADSLLARRSVTITTITEPKRGFKNTDIVVAYAGHRFSQFLERILQEKSGHLNYLFNRL